MDITTDGKQSLKITDLTESIPLDCKLFDKENTLTLEPKSDLTALEGMQIALIFSSCMLGGGAPVTAVKQLGLERHFKIEVR